MVVVASRFTGGPRHRIMSEQADEVVVDGRPRGMWFRRVCMCGWRSSSYRANTMGRNRSSVEVSEHWSAVGFIETDICWEIE